MYPINLPTLAFIAAVVGYGISALLYRGALVRQGAPPIGAAGRADSILDPMVQEGIIWARALVTHQPRRKLEVYRLVNLLFMAAAAAALAWVVLSG